MPHLSKYWSVTLLFRDTVYKQSSQRKALDWNEGISAPFRIWKLPSTKKRFTDRATFTGVLEGPAGIVPVARMWTP